MTQFKLPLAAASAATCFIATPGLADITPDDVWSNWQTYFSSFADSFTAEETRSGDDISLKGLTLSIELPEEEGTVAITMPDIDFVSNGDGTVGISYSTGSGFGVSGEGDGETFEMSLGFDHTGMSVVASGAPNDITYSYAAASMTYTLGEFLLNGEPIDPAEFTAEGTVDVSQVAGLINVSTGDVISISQDVTYGDIAYDVRIVVPEEDTNLVTTASMQDLAVEAELSWSANANLDDPYTIFNDDLNIAVAYTSGPTESAMSGSDETGPFSSESTSSGGALELIFNSNEFVMSADTLDTSFTFFGAGIPLPVSGEIGEVSMGMAVPLKASESPMPFGMNIAMADVIMPDLLWDIFDPAAVLERSPATIRLGLEGTTKLFLSAFDPAFIESDDAPGELNSLTLTELELSIAGAELTGSGDFTFDNSDLESFDGFPRPAGSADFRLTGGNALLDSLIQMGLVSENDAMGARMMMGVFTVAGPGDDELTSRLEVDDNGHVLANGQRLR